MLDSIESQNYNNYEHIIYDGGSRDGSLDLLTDYAANKLNVSLEIGRDTGQTNAINSGFLDAQGDIITWLNTDDAYFDEHVLQQVTIFDDMKVEEHKYNTEQTNETHKCARVRVGR